MQGRGDEARNIYKMTEDMEMKVSRENNSFKYETGVKQAQRLKEEGNAFFKQNKYQQALDCYLAALSCLPDNNDEELRFTLYNNLTLMSLKLQDYNKAIEYADQGIMFNSKDLKILFRKGRALSKLGRYKEALDYLLNKQ